MIRFTTLGIPITQGSKTAFVVGKRAIVVDGKGAGAKRHKDWRADVRRAAQEAAFQFNVPLDETPVDQMPFPATTPLVVRCWFGMPKPASAPKRTRTWPIKARSGDIDKLARSILDSCTGVLFADDSQVVMLCAHKDWAERPGVTVEIEEVGETWTWGLGPGQVSNIQGAAGA